MPDRKNIALICKPSVSGETSLLETLGAVVPTQREPDAIVRARPVIVDTPRSVTEENDRNAPRWSVGLSLAAHVCLGLAALPGQDAGIGEARTQIEAISIEVVSAESLAAARRRP